MFFFNFLFSQAWFESLTSEENNLNWSKLLDPIQSRLLLFSFGLLSLEVLIPTGNFLPVITVNKCEIEHTPSLSLSVNQFSNRLTECHLLCVRENVADMALCMKLLNFSEAEGKIWQSAWAKRENLNVKSYIDGKTDLGLWEWK